MLAPTARRRAILLALPATYVAISAIASTDATPGTWITIVAALVVAVVGARATDGAALACAGGLSVVLATSAFPGRPGWVAAARGIGALICAVVAARAVARIEGDTGLALKATEALEAQGASAKTIARAGVAAVAASWGTAAAVDVLTWAGAIDPSWESTAPVLAAVAGAVSLFAVGLVALLVAAARRLELAAPPRALACSAAAGVALLSAIALAIGGVFSADASAAVTGAIASAVIVRFARVRDASVGDLARRGRRALALLLYGGPVVVLAALVSAGRVTSASGVVIVLALAAGAVAIGASAHRLEESFLPMRGVWLEALALARDTGRDRESRAAIAHALVKIREAAQVGAGATSVPSPELWMLHPTRVMTVNAAGYLQEKEAELPDGVFDVCTGEPHATVRTAVLSALEVRRPDLRPLLKWMETRGAMFATAIAETGGAGEPDGLLVVPAGGRHEPMTLEETIAAKRVADAFVAVCQAMSARERHLARERSLKDRIDALEDELERANHAAGLHATRNVLATTRLARPATVGIYSAAARMAYDALERRVTQDAPLVLIARSGIDPVPYLARAHLGGPRKDAPLVVVDGTSSREHDVERWKDDRASPLGLADRGMLVLLDAPALPRDVQVLVARALVERRPPWERAAPLDIAVAMTASSPLEALVEEARLSPELFARFEDAPPIQLPGLRERPEDLRSIVADRLAREGLRVRGRPMGIDAAAYSRLVEHPFEGEDAELTSIVTRLVANVEGDIVRAADVDALGIFDPAALSWSAHSQTPE